MIDVQALQDWLVKRKKKLEDKAAPSGKPVDLPGGVTIHIHLNTNDKSESAQKLPLTADGTAVATRDAIAKYPG